ncbi:MAG: restriction endonuclease subunit S [Daejeonella sp.]|uniref:restriction endonuclease subunit S n=1 Tax=Daejeonella sp. TaxID=2805397 RepID=UPI003C708A52
MDSGIPLLRSECVTDEGFNKKGLSYITKEANDHMKRSKVLPGDILVSITGNVGRIAIFPDSLKHGNINQHIARVRIANDLCDKIFIYFQLCQNAYRQYYNGIVTGAAYPQLSLKQIRETPIHLPPLLIQTRIASILSAYDDLIENNLKRIKLLEELAQRTYEEWFVKYRVNGEALVFDRETGLPEGWERKKLREVIGYEIGGGWGEAEKTEEFCNPGYVIRGTDIDPLYAGNIKNVPSRFHKKSNMASRKIQPGDIIFEVSGGSSNEGVAKSFLMTTDVLKQFDGDVMCASFCKLVRPAKPELSNLLYLTFKFFRKIKTTEIWEIRSASNILNYNWTAFLAFQNAVLPPDKILNNFNSIISPLYSQIYNLGFQNRLFKQSRDILLPRLMNGNINVEEVEERFAIAAEPIPEYITRA